MSDQPKPIALASDHAGLSFKERTKKMLERLGLPYRDFGTNSSESVDYPDFAHKAAEAIAAGECDRGIFICGSGIGVAIVANKSKGVRAAACTSPEMATVAREHNDINVLTLGERLVEWEVAKEIIEAFLDTPFAGGRHERRVEKIHSLTGC